MARSRKRTATTRRAVTRSIFHDLPADWYWEQDAELRFTKIESNRRDPAEKALVRRQIGKRRWETGVEIEGGWEAHRALLEARQPFRDVLMWRTFDDGDRRYLSVSGEPVFDARKRFTGYRGNGRDVTAQQRVVRLLRLEHRVTRCLAEAQDAPRALRAALKAISETEGWDCGQFWKLDAAREEMRHYASWAAPGNESAQRFDQASRELVFRQGTGLVGTAWQSGEPLWIQDSPQDPRAARQDLSLATGLRGAVLFPIRLGGRVTGVLAFASQRLRPPHKRLSQALQVIATMLGQYLERADAEQAVRDSEARFRRLTEMSSDFYWETDAMHRSSQIVHGPNYPDVVLRGALGRSPWELPSVSPDEAGWAAQRALMEQHLPFRDFEFGRTLPDGATRYFAASGEPRFAADGTFLGYQGVGRDITEIVLARERISSLAYSDPLTGLANRASFGPSLEQAVQRARRRSSKIALVFVDLDGFKLINDLRGHDAGDALLIELAGRLRANLRASDLVARLGGDEFLVVVEEVQEAAPIETVAKKLLSEAARPYALAGGDAKVTASIGISIFPDDAGDAQSLLKHADTAMYAAKQAGKNTYRFYASGPAANDPARRRDSESAG